MSFQALIAGVGNIFLGDDGFGVEVARKLCEQDMPEWVRVADYGIRGMHLAHDLANTGYDLTIIVDAVSLHDPPGTISVIELDTSGDPDAGLLDGHGMEPDAVMRIVSLLGGRHGRVLLVGCEPGSLAEHMGLSPAVAAAVSPATDTVRALITKQEKELTCALASPER
ncbi:hydrogenase maturation protease [Kibdelosporangium banguiense]|uniref:Hydrogenase maturation protease n=1 Tax=Kibdelosporangium banguiense TaxID=1365924 RepID=A0ABS4T6H5_9PSEU|nr:hydrogenase maturation protease [Kibdelosporangium banguiense]MBP2320041.1 hydrogenase maturation protease [Kibdelosporangium banguiense]